MKYLKKFNESKGYDYEIVDYFIDLEDEGIINIREIVDIIGKCIKLGGIYKRNIEELINNARGIKNTSHGSIRINTTFEIEQCLKEYLDDVSIQTPEEFFDFVESDRYIPLLSMSISPSISNTKKYTDDWMDEIREAIKRCEETSSITKIYGMLNTHPGIVNIYFSQTTKWNETSQEIQ